MRRVAVAAHDHTLGKAIGERSGDPAVGVFFQIDKEPLNLPAQNGADD